MNLVAEDDLEPLITECPNCHTRFRVVEAQLQSAQGRVRCGACLAVFNGVEHLVWEDAARFSSTEEAQGALDDLLSELEEAAERRSSAAAGDAAAAARADHGPASTHTGQHARVVPIFSGYEDEGPLGVDEGADTQDQAAVEPEIEVVREIVAADANETAQEASGAFPAETAPETRAEATETREAQTPEAQTPEAQTPEAQTSEAQTPEAQSEPHPESAEAVASAEAPDVSAPPVVFGEPIARRPLVWLGIAAAVAGIVAQVLWYQFDDWSRSPFWRPVYAQVCGLVGCELPVQRDVALLRTQNLLVRSHPTEPGALAVNAVIVNEASFAQPFPALELRFTSMNGDLVALRVFQPEEYLSGEAADMALMPARTPVQVQLDIEDPGPDAVNYTMKIR